MMPPRAEKISLGQHLSYVCSRFLAFGLPLLFFLVLTSFYLKTYDSAQIKITITQIGTLVLFAVWVFRMLIEGRFPFTKNDLLYIAPILAFLISGIAVWLHSPFKEWSFEETSRRFFYMVLALIAIAEINTGERIKRFWRWLIAAAWFSIGYGVLQFVEMRFFQGPTAVLDPFIWRGAFGHRVFSTFGNPNFYGNFLVIMTPIIMASVFKEKGSLLRIASALFLTVALFVVIDKTTRGIFGGFDPSFELVYFALAMVAFALLLYTAFWQSGASSSRPMFILLFAALFLNLYSTETKGAWVGFMAAMGATLWLVFENFLHFESYTVSPRKYWIFLGCLISGFVVVFSLMVHSFIMPLFIKEAEQIGFKILWIPTLIAMIVGAISILWLLKKPWNLKKIVYGVLIFTLISLGGGVLQFSKTRLVSISFRMFTWISTWEMIQTNPILGSGVGTFKIIYPAFRRPQIIALEGKSNTETDHAEDEYIEVWQDEGIIGFGIFLWMVIFSVFLGIKQLAWYSRLYPFEKGKDRKLMDVQNSPRSYEVLGFLGAYIGALIHWLFDVSVRFVSSGIFSGLLPGVLVAYARNNSRPVVEEVRMPYDRWIRVGLAASWTVIFAWLGLELVPQSMIEGGDTTNVQIFSWIFLAGALIFVLLELLEFGNNLHVEGELSSLYPPVNQNKMVLRWLMVPAVCAFTIYGVIYFGGHFFGDVNHNLAIFFSKEAIWTKSPLYNSKLMNYPIDIREKYEKTGGALEHYEKVTKLNHSFPMAHYFRGNVYNDWGSQDHMESLNLRAQGKMEDAKRLHDRTIEKWNKSEEAYQATRDLAPNYVQTHHQLGLLWVKRAEQAAAWGDPVKSHEYYQKALSYFELYKKIDPVFPPNYDRIVQIKLMDGKLDEAIDLYTEAMYYNYDVVMSIHNRVFEDRVTALALSLAKLHYSRVSNKQNIYKPPVEDVKQALKYFKMAVAADENNVEAWKGLGFLSEKVGDFEASQAAYRHVLKLSPQDPDLRSQPAL